MSRSGFARNHLRSYIERIERLEEEKAAIAADVREVYGEAKGAGFEPKIMRMVIRLRKLDTAARQEQEALLDLYMGALEGGAAVPDGVAAQAERTVTDYEQQMAAH